MIEVALIGANGKMGKSISDLIAKDKEFSLKYAIITSKDYKNISLQFKPKIISDKITDVKSVNAIIEFSSTINAINSLKFAIENKIPIIIGVTGFDKKQLSVIKKLTKNPTIPILISPNMSVSVNILFNIIKNISINMKDFDTEIIESHHRNKLDAPSGTSLKIGEIIAHARNKTLEQIAIFNRVKKHQKRNKNEIGFSSIRGGNIIGAHEVLYISDHETLSIKSDITNREAFAKGALIATKFVTTAKAGLYDMQAIFNKQL